MTRKAKQPENRPSEKWTLQRILALAGIVLLLVLYALTMVFALMDSPTARGLLMAAVFCTIAVPVLLYAMILVARNLRKKNEELFGISGKPEMPETESKPDPERNTPEEKK